MNNMTQSGEHPNLIHDNRLAEFTDLVLEGKVKHADSNVEEELLDLEQTILRLNQAFPPVSLDDATVKKMQVRLSARMRRETQQAKQPFWKKWFEPRYRLQFGMAFTLAALMIVFAIFAPSTGGGSSVTGTALTPLQGPIVVVVLAGLVLFVYWMNRRK
jgi:hypothetical protein